MSGAKLLMLDLTRKVVALVEHIEKRDKSPPSRRLALAARCFLVAVEDYLAEEDAIAV